MGLLIFIPFIIRNYIRATAVKLTGWLWALYTFGAMILATIIGGMIQVFIIMYQDANFTRIVTTPGVSREELTKIIQEKQTIFTEFFIIVSAVGGYLFVRHLLVNRSGREETGS